jgi:hypothetical protein
MGPHTKPSLERAVIVGCISALLAGCGLRQLSLADRCANVMQEALAGSKLEITEKRAAFDFSNDLITATAVVQGSASKTSSPPRDIGMECTFSDNVLSGFRWTAGEGS